MAQEVRFALTDSNGQLTGSPKAQVESIAQGKADAVKALIPDASTFVTQEDFDAYKATAGTGGTGSSSVVDNGDGTATITL